MLTKRAVKVFNDLKDPKDLRFAENVVTLRQNLADMTIGIVVAMGKELDLLLPLIGDACSEEREGVVFHTGRIGEHSVVAMQCGIGKVNAALGVDALIRLYAPELVINSGVAGGADASMHVLDLLVATGVAYHDVWCGPGTEYGAAAGMPVVMTPSAKVLAAAERVLTQPNVRRGLICSGDKFISTAAEVAEIKRHFPEALAVDMESAALAQTCMKHGVPFAVIRAISDTPGQAENISQYQNFWTDAPAETFGALTALLAEL